MNMKSVSLLLVASVGLCSAQDDISAKLTPSALNARIAQIRMGDIAIKTKPGAEVKVQQVRHEFLFGTAVANQLVEKDKNAMSPEDRKMYLKVLSENFNYAVHENALKVFVPEKGKFYIGKATTRNLAHFLPVAATGLDIEGMTSILLGSHPEIKGKTITIDGSPEGTLYKVDILSEGIKIQSLWADPEGRLVRVDLFTGDNSRLYSARFMGRDRIENMTLPQNVTIAYGENDKPDIIIRYVDIGPAKGIDAAIFDLKCPPGIIPISLDR